MHEIPRQCGTLMKGEGPAPFFSAAFAMMCMKQDKALVESGLQFQKSQPPGVKQTPVSNLFCLWYTVKQQ